jgi:tol-pal system protein YbgF
MKTTLPILFALLFLVTGCAIQQDIIVLENRIAYLERKNRELEQELEKDLDALGRTREDSEKNLRAQYAGVNANLETIQQDFRLLNGRIEEVEYLINRKVTSYEAGSQEQKTRLDEISVSLAKLEQRIAQMEQYLSIEGKKRPSTADGGQPPPAQTDLQLYSSGRQAYDKGELDKARQIFQSLIQKYPQSETVDNAQFWIGESYYREEWYERAILEYQTVIEKYPKGNKVPAAMLKQGLALLKIGEKSSARLILQELVKKYPKASEADIARKKMKEF